MKEREGGGLVSLLFILAKQKNGFKAFMPFALARVTGFDYHQFIISSLWKEVFWIYIIIEKRYFIEKHVFMPKKTILGVMLHNVTKIGIFMSPLIYNKVRAPSKTPLGTIRELISEILGTH